MIYAKDITDFNHVKGILDSIRNNVVACESMYGKVSEEVLENITFQLCEIEEFIIGPQKYTETNIINSDLRMMGYWEYIDGKCSFLDIVREMKENEGDI
ncbi:hypothetical protein [Alkaliphilus transvaalensis]|uniref:hypothetical protein n=1 Tax=Alkaliphilus transvaalensis TaxID=114628 RepID=UPI00047A75FF|nr:hypothetical protein [Alkaliphilus transvaalensis]